MQPPAEITLHLRPAFTIVLSTSIARSDIWSFREYRTCCQNNGRAAGMEAKQLDGRRDACTKMPMLAETCRNDRPLKALYMSSLLSSPGELREIVVSLAIRITHLASFAGAAGVVLIGWARESCWRFHHSPEDAWCGQASGLDPAKAWAARQQRGCQHM